MTDVLLALNELEKMGKPIKGIINNFINDYDLKSNDIYFIVYIDETLTINDIKKIIRSNIYSWNLYRNSIIKAIEHDNKFVLNKLLESNTFLPEIIGNKIIWGNLFERWNCFEILNRALINEKFTCFQMLYDYFYSYIEADYGSVINYKKNYINGSLMYELWNIIVNLEVSNKKLENILNYLNRKNLLFRRNLKDYNRFEYFITFCKKTYITDRVKILNKYNICIFKNSEKIKKQLDPIYSEKLDELYNELEIEIPNSPIIREYKMW